MLKIQCSVAALDLVVELFYLGDCRLPQNLHYTVINYNPSSLGAIYKFIGLDTKHL